MSLEPRAWDAKGGLCCQRGTAPWRGWVASIPCLQPCWSVRGIWLALTPLVTRLPAPNVSPQTRRTVCLGGIELQVGWQPAGLLRTRWVPPLARTPGALASAPASLSPGLPLQSSPSHSAASWRHGYLVCAAFVPGPGWAGAAPSAVSGSR